MSALEEQAWAAAKAFGRAAVQALGYQTAALAAFAYLAVAGTVFPAVGHVIIALLLCGMVAQAVRALEEELIGKSFDPALAAMCDELAQEAAQTSEMLDAADLRIKELQDRVVVAEAEIERLKKQTGEKGGFST